MKRILLLSCVCTLAASIGPAAASASQWKHTLTPYALASSMDGRTAIGPLEADVNKSFSDIWSNLDFGAMANYRAEKDKLSFGLDVIYMGLSGRGPGLLGVEVEVDQWMVEGTAGWRVSDAIELFGGVRYNSVATKIALTAPVEFSRSRREDWYDPIIGARAWLPLGGSFSALLHGDIGGFDVGSHLTWQLGAHLRYAFSNSFSALLGYRYMGVDYETGEGLNRYVYDMSIQGPNLGFSWEF